MPLWRAWRNGALERAGDGALAVEKSSSARYIYSDIIVTVIEIFVYHLMLP